MGRIALLTVAYVVTAQLGLVLRQVHEVTSLLWAPSGIMFAALVRYGVGIWPAIAIGAFVNTMITGRPVLAGVWVTYANVVELLAATYVLGQLACLQPSLNRVRDVVLVILIALSISFLSATIAAGGLGVWGYVAPDNVPALWWAWWWGHLSGILIVAPLIMTWPRGTRVERPTGPRRGEAVLLAVSLFAIELLVVSPWSPPWLEVHAKFYLVPLLMWTAMRFGPIGAARASFAVNVGLVAGTGLGLDPYQDFRALQSFLSVSSITALLVSALTSERLHALQIKAAVLCGALDAIITIDDNDSVVEFNPAAERLFGFRAEDILGKQLAPRLVLPELRTAYRDLLAAHYKLQKPFVNRIRTMALRADGQTFPIELAITRVPVDDRVLVAGFIRDLTAEQQAEAVRRESVEMLERSVDVQTAELMRSNAELQNREKLLRRAETLAHLGSFELDLQTSTLQWSEELYRIYGRDPETFSPSFDDFLASVHADDRMRIASLVARALRDQSTFAFEERIVRPDGTVRVLASQGEVHVDDQGHAVKVCGCCQDITPRKQAEAARDRLAEMVESSEDAIIGLSTDGTVESWNAAAGRTFGYSRAAIIGESCERLVPPEATNELREVLARVLAGNHLAHREMVHRRADGTHFDASITVSAIAEPGGRVIGISEVIRDVSERNLAEANLRSSLREKEVLLREIHHRVKNNLQVISSLLNLQLASEASDAARRRLLESQSRVLSMALVHELLYQSKDFSHIDLGTYLNNLAMRLASTYQLDPQRIEIVLHAEPIQLDIDRAIPCGLIVNELITNSLRHAFPGDRTGRITVEIKQADGSILLSVRDNGVGLPADFTTSGSFGFQIARTLSQQLGGTIEVERDQGTAVTIEIPIAPDKPPS